MQSEKIEQLYELRQDEMNQFYNQIDQQPHQGPEKQLQVKANDYDEKPIAGTNKNFEEILQEKLANEPEAQEDLKQSKESSRQEKQENNEEKQEKRDKEMEEIKNEIKKEIEQQRVARETIKKYEDLTKLLQQERGELHKEIKKFRDGKEQLFEEERKKQRKENKQQEKQQKQLYEDQVNKDKQEIESLQDQLKLLKAQYDQQEAQQKIEIHKQLKNYCPILFRLKKEIQDTQKSMSPQKSPLKESKSQDIIYDIQAPSKFGFPMNFEDGYNITMNDFVKKKINEEFLDYDKNDRYLHYQATQDQYQELINQTDDLDGKQYQQFKGKKIIIFPTGIQKEIFKDGYTLVKFTNNDIKQVFPNGVVVYYFNEAQATQTTLPNGQNIYKFSDNTIELHNKNGTKEIKNENGIVTKSKSESKIKKRPFK